MAIAYLTATVTTGATSGERPGRAWRLGAVGGWSLLLGALAGYLANAALWLTYAPASGTAPDIYFRFSEALGYVTAAGYLFLLAAFALGLPGVDELEPAGDATRSDDVGPFDRERRPTSPTQRPDDLTYARSIGSEAARFRRKLTPSSTDSTGAYGPGMRKHGRPASATPDSTPHGSSRAWPAAIEAARL